MNATVVIPVRNMATVLGAQLDALYHQTATTPWEVVVVDNASSDDTLAVAQGWAQRFSRLRVIEAAERPSAGHARNVGASSVGGRSIGGPAVATDALLFCDADDIVGPGWVAAMVEALHEHELVTGPFECYRLNPPHIARLMPAFTTGSPPTAYQYLQYATTANMGVRRGLFDALGGFRARYFTGNDLDFTWRAQLAGATLYFEPRAVVHRRLPQRLGLVARRQASYSSEAPLLYQDYGRYGMPASPPLRAVRYWLALTLRSPALLLPSRRGPWCRDVGHQLGRLVGSARHRCLYL
ncbi:MAG: hypothetical protein DLM54_08580 [Acidimicrobiales bacterium]|nr:MAG: hypothetical protein DLM54_08580 [Acidimicrobiales bacterium]